MQGEAQLRRCDGNTKHGRCALMEPISRRWAERKASVERRRAHKMVDEKDRFIIMYREPVENQA